MPRQVEACLGRDFDADRPVVEKGRPAFDSDLPTPEARFGRQFPPSRRSGVCVDPGVARVPFVREHRCVDHRVVCGEGFLDVRPRSVHPIQFHRIIVTVDKLDLHFDHFPHPLLELVPIGGLQSREVAGQRIAAPSEKEERLSRLSELITRWDVEEFCQLVAAMVPDFDRLEEVLPPDPLRRHGGKRVREHHFVVGELLHLFRRHKAHEQMLVQHIVVVQHDRLELLEADNVQDTRLCLLDLELVLESDGRPPKGPREGVEVAVVLLLLLLIPPWLRTARIAAGPVVHPATGIVGQHLKGVHHLPEGFGGFFGGNVCGALVGVCFPGLAPVRLLDLLGGGLARHVQQPVQVIVVGFFFVARCDPRLERQQQQQTKQPWETWGENSCLCGCHGSGSVRFRAGPPAIRRCHREGEKFVMVILPANNVFRARWIWSFCCTLIKVY